MLRALSKYPANRCQAAAEMRVDLVRVCSGQAPLAPVVVSGDKRSALFNPASTGHRRINGTLPFVGSLGGHRADEPDYGEGGLDEVGAGHPRARMIRSRCASFHGLPR